MDFIITHDGRDWVIENDSLRLASPTLDQLDMKLGDIMRARGLVKKGETAKVFMGFDNSTIPEWMRPFSQHYFNRVVEIKGTMDNLQGG